MKIFSRELNDALVRFLEENKTGMILGEDIRDPYGGAFSITKGLSDRFHERVWNTPISEAALVGFSAGLASKGIPTILELMFGDFSLLTLDQLHNTVSKVAFMGDLSLPLIIRTPMGGYRGYGPTHSQTLSRFIVGSENVEVISVSNFVSPLESINSSLKRNSVSFFVEDKMTYSEAYLGNVECLDDLFDIIRLGKPFIDVYFRNKIRSSRSKPLLVCFGGSIRIALKAAKELLLKHEIAADLYQVNSFWPINIDSLLESMGRRQNVLFVEEGWVHYGLAGEFTSQLLATKDKSCDLLIRRIGAKSSIIPASAEGEYRILPSSIDILNSVIQMETN